MKNLASTALISLASVFATVGSLFAEPPLTIRGSGSENKINGLFAELLAESPGPLTDAAAEQRVWNGRVQAEVEQSLSAARKRMATNPAQAEQDLKLMLEHLQAVPIDFQIRNQLQGQLSTAVRQSRRRKIEVDQQTAAAQEQQAAAMERGHLDTGLALHQQRIKQLVDRFDSLLSEERYAVADQDVTPEVRKLAPGSTIESSVAYGGSVQRAVYENEQVKQSRHNNYVRALAQTEKSLIPFPDDLPIAYPPADQWEDLTLKRQKFRTVDLQTPSGAEQRIFNELNRTANLDVVEMPLKDVVQYLNELHGIPIVLSSKKIDEAGVNIDTLVTKNLRGITLRSALRLLLRDLELTYVIRDEVLEITTPEDAQDQLLTKVYPVGDLVVPITSGAGNLFGLGGIGNSGLSGVGNGFGNGNGNGLGNGFNGGGGGGAGPGGVF